MPFIVIIKDTTPPTESYCIFGPIESECQAILFANKFTYTWRDNPNIEAYIREIIAMPGIVPNRIPMSGLGRLSSRSSDWSRTEESDAKNLH